MVDDEASRADPGTSDLFGPPGPRRSNFTPAPTDAESLEAAANVFNDDAIAAALAAELARVSSGPIPTQQAPAAVPPVSSPAVQQSGPSTPQAPTEIEPERDEPRWDEPRSDEPEDGAPEDGETELDSPSPFASQPSVAQPASAAPLASAPVAAAPVEPESVASAPVAPESVAPVDPEPVAPEPVEAQSVSADEDEPEPAPPASAPPSWAPVAGTPSPVEAEPVASSPVSSEPIAQEPAVQESEPAFQESAAQEPVTSEPEAHVPSTPEPAAPTAETAQAPVGPPDWASSLFGQPTPTIRDEQPAVVQDPFAPSAPSFAPSTGAFPPPSEVDGTAGMPPITSDPEALRALYRGAPAPTVPPADAPPPPGYGPTVASVPEPPAVSVPSPPDGARRRSLNEEALRGDSNQSMIAGTPEEIQALQEQLHLSEQDAREFAVWESSMQAIGTPEAIAEIARARGELEGAAMATPVAPVAPVVDEPVNSAPPPPVVEPAAYLPSPPVVEPAAYLPSPPVVEPAAYLPSPPVVEPAAYLPSPPVVEPAAYLPSPPVDQPVAYAPSPPADEPIPFAPPPPVDEPAAFLPPPPVDEPAAYLPPPPVDEPAAYLPPPVDEPVAFAPPPVDEPVAFAPPPVDEPAAYLPPPPSEQEPAAYPAPPSEEPAAVLPPPLEGSGDVLPPPTFEQGAGEPFAQTPAAPFDDPYTTPSPSVDGPAGATDTASIDDDPFNAFIQMAEERQEHESGSPSSSPVSESPFAGLEPPEAESPFATFAAPADPRDLHFGPQDPIPDAPVFLEPPALIEPAPKTDGVADLYRDAGEVPPPLSVPSPPSVAPDMDRWTPTDVPATPAAAPAGFDDLLTGSVEPPASVASAPWISPDAVAPVVPDPGVPDPVAPDPVVPDPVAPDPVVPDPVAPPESETPPPPTPDPVPAPAEEPAPGDHRPFGEGVERDDAVDPSDSIFGPVSGVVTVNPAGVAVISEAVPGDSQPIRVIETGGIAVVATQPTAAPQKVVPAEEVGLEPTPEEARVGRSARLFWLWFAANSSIVAIVFGTIIFALGLSVRQAIIAVLAGVALSFIPLGLGTLAGKRSGQPTMVISRATFGTVGNILPALLALFSRLLWAAALLWVLGAAVAQLLTGAQLSGGLGSSQITLLTMAVGIIIAIVIAYFGYGLIAKVQLVISIVSGVAIVGFIALTAQYLDLRVALTVDDGPWILVVTGAVLVFSFVGLAWANSGADVARYQRPGSSGGASMLWATFGAALPTFILIAYGALLAASNPTLAGNIAKDPLDSLGRLLPVWYPAPLLVATGLSLISAVVLSMYSGGFALQAAGLRLRRSLSALLVGLLVIVLAVSIELSVTDGSQLLRDVSTAMAVPIAAWVGIFAVETMIRRRPLDAQSLLNRGGAYPDVRWFNFIALILISVVGFGFLSASMPALSWEGYGFVTLGVPLSSQLAQSDLGVLVALFLGMLVALATGFTAIRKQEGQEPVGE